MSTFMLSPMPENFLSASQNLGIVNKIHMKGILINTYGKLSFSNKKAGTSLLSEAR